MHYDLGVGLGGSTTTAAVLRGAAAGHPEVVLSEPVAAGDPAARGALDRVGDPVPLLTARGPRAGADLVAATVGCVVQRATVSEGGAPRAIAVTRPASWGAHRDRALTEALATASSSLAPLNLL